MYIREWLNIAQIDYFSMFIKAWIPFNAWYMAHYYDESQHRTSDRTIIDHICKTDNHYRARIMSLLQNGDAESLSFQQKLANIQKKLLEHPMPSIEKQLTLDTVYMEQIYTTDIVKIGRYRIYDIKCSYTRSLPRGSKRIKCEVIRRSSNHTKYLIEQSEWSKTEFETINEYRDIHNDLLRNAIIDVYEQINPQYPTKITCSLIRRGDEEIVPRNSIRMGEKDSIYITNNIELVATVVINLLYELRCKLFHGEVDPLEVYQPIYQYAYEIQMMLNKEIK